MRKLPELPEVIETLQRIQTAVDEAIEMARETDGSWQTELINWADLYCVEVVFVVNRNAKRSFIQR